MAPHLTCLEDGPNETVCYLELGHMGGHLWSVVAPSDRVPRWLRRLADDDDTLTRSDLVRYAREEIASRSGE